MIEFVDFSGVRFAIIIPHTYTSDGIEFYTESDYSQQLGYMKRDQNYTIRPHRHKLNERTVKKTQEVLFIRSGCVRVDFFGDENNFLGYRILQGGDVIMLCEGGHGFTFLEPSEVIEVKQGPYSEALDKEYLD